MFLLINVAVFMLKKQSAITHTDVADIPRATIKQSVSNRMMTITFLKCPLICSKFVCVCVWVCGVGGIIGWFRRVRGRRRQMNQYWIQHTRADSFSPAVIFLGAPIQNSISNKFDVEKKQFISCVRIKKSPKYQKTVNNRDVARVIGRSVRKQRERAENNREKGWEKREIMAWIRDQSSPFVKHRQGCYSKPETGNLR